MQDFMPIRAIDNPILKRFRAALDGDRLEGVVLFGSHAREDSDYDIAVFMQDLDLLQ
jgi:predicted nucleotidyltransferase